MLGECIAKAKIVKGIAAVAPGDEEGTMVVLVDDKRFQKVTKCFDQKNKWEVVQISPAINNVLDFQNASLSIYDVINQLEMTHQLTGKEEQCLPLLNWIYSFLGKFHQEKNNEIYILLTNNLTKTLGLNDSQIHAKITMERMAAIDPDLLLYNYTQLFGRKTLPCVTTPHQIFNPLNYRPAGDTVVAVPRGLICKAISNCTTDIARGMGDFMAKCFNHFLQKAAESHAEAVGDEVFEETVVQPAQEALKDFAESEALMAERKAAQEAMERHRAAHKLHLEQLCKDLQDKELQLSLLQKELLENQDITRKQKTEIIVKQSELVKAKNLMRVELSEKEIKIAEKEVEIARKEEELETKDRDLQASQNECRIIALREEQTKHKLQLQYEQNTPIISHYTENIYRNHMKSHWRIGNTKNRIDHRIQPVAFLAGALETINMRRLVLEKLIDRPLVNTNHRKMFTGIVNLANFQDKLDRFIVYNAQDVYAAGVSLNVNFINWTKVAEEDEETYKAMNSWLKFKPIIYSQE